MKGKKIQRVMIVLCFIIAACSQQEAAISESQYGGTSASNESPERVLPIETQQKKDITTKQAGKRTATPQPSQIPTEIVTDQPPKEMTPGDNETLLLEFNPEETNSIYMNVSPDGKKIAYKKFTEHGQSVIFDGNEFGPYDEVEFIDFSPDSSQLVFVATLGEENFVVLDGVEQEYYDMVSPPIRFFPADRVIGYQASLGDKTIAIIGDLKYEYDDINSPIYMNPESGSFAFVARNINAEHFVVHDGIEGKRYDDIEIYNLDLYFSEDGNHLAYVAQKGKNWYVVMDGVESSPFIGSYIDIAFSPDSDHIVYAAPLGERKVLFYDGTLMDDYDSYFAPIFSQDSQHFAHKAAQDGDVFVVVDGIEGTKHDGTLSGFTFSPDGQHYAYKVDSDDGYLFVIDGEIQDVKDVRRPPIFSPDSQHIAYQVYTSEHDILMQDREIIGNYDEIKYVTFSPDSNHLLAIVQDDETWDDYIVVNGLPGNKYDEILKQIIFDDAKSFHYVAIKGDKVYLVNETIE